MSSQRSIYNKIRNAVTKMSITPEQVSVLQTLLTSKTKASAITKIPIHIIEEFVTNAVRFASDNHALFETLPYVLFLNFGNPAVTPANHIKALAQINSGKPYLYVNEHLTLISSKEGKARLVDICRVTEAENNFALFVNGGYAYQILCGRLEEETSIVDGGSEIPIISPLFRSISEFSHILADHMQRSIDNEQRVKIWFDKSKRVLLAGSDGTENIFHLELFWWLKHYVSDKIAIYAEPKGLGQDKTDIVVVTQQGSYVIEVKWLGKNQNNTEYKQQRIDEGLVQVDLYLQNERKFVCGMLVMYDGRSYLEHVNNSSYDEGKKNPLCQRPEILFLKSETPSVAAVRIVRESK